MSAAPGTARRLPGALVALTAIYALTVGRLAPADLAAGALVSALALLLTHRRAAPFAVTAPPGLGRRLLWLPVVLLALLGDALRSTWRISLIVLGRRPLDGPGLVEIPMGDRSDSAIVASGLLRTVPPGSVLVEVDLERRVALYHVLGERDAESARAAEHRFYRRWLRRVFP